MATLEEHHIEPFDLVCVNLYPFEEVSGKKGVTEAEAVEMIDVGGRRCARRREELRVLRTGLPPERYGFVLDELRSEGELSIETRRELASEAFATTAAYEAAIATWFAERGPSPTRSCCRSRRCRPLVRREPASASRVLRGARQPFASPLARRAAARQGAVVQQPQRPLAARLLAREFALPACVIVKHANPCGVAIGATVDESVRQGARPDPTSAYGGIVVLNRGSTADLAKVADQFVEVLFAPDYDDDALAALTRKQGTRILVDRERRRVEADLRHYKRVLGGLLVQDPDTDIEDREGWQVACGTPDEAAVGRPRLRLACLQARLVECDRARPRPRDDRDRRGTDERVDAVRIAVEKATTYGHEIRARPSRPTPSSRSPTDRASRSTPGRPRSCSRADRSATRM